MTEHKGLEEGTRVRITLEGVVAKGDWEEAYVGSDEYDLGYLEVEGINERLYFENLPISAVEVLGRPKRTYRNGLYYGVKSSTHEGAEGMQLAGVYKHVDGYWYDNRLNHLPGFDPGSFLSLRYLVAEGGDE